MHRDNLFPPNGNLCKLNILKNLIAEMLSNENCSHLSDQQITERKGLTNMQNIFSEALVNKEMPNTGEIRKMLTERWGNVANTASCYSMDTDSQINKLYIEIAQFFFKANANHYLMPTVRQEDIYSNNINTLKLGEFILNDSASDFIHIRSLLKNALAKYAQSENEVFIICENENANMRPLSEKEEKRLTTAYPILKDFFRTIREPDQTDAFNPKAQLHKLRNGLIAGDKKHGGCEREAGISADTALIEFTKFWDASSAELKSQIGNLESKTTGITFNRLYTQLTKPVANAISTCVELQGGVLDSILINPNNSSFLQSTDFRKGRIAELFKIMLKLCQDLPSHKSKLGNEQPAPTNFHR